VCDNSSTEEPNVYVILPQQGCLVCVEEWLKRGANVCVIVAQQRALMYV
jgi:hypothetical protein